ncbi:DUF2993 domain-containing protein [Prochlorococcus sp. MIT 1341]|uniref:LmeA family phospholipid-binding protein n=1 Tax=Prochlorococcus sp. MIT 1341 TaxID=3096221 RepID=UPI002A761503|nr:DUF2993 domain-containing protein [Prochlorococcus sp. MIT 1341]
MNDSPGSKSDPLLNILAKGLKIWIRSKCESVADLSLVINGSGLELLRGNLSGVSVNAREISFRGLQIDDVEIQSNSLKLSYNLKKINKLVSLNEPFHINGCIKLSNAGINEFFSSESFNNLGQTVLDKLFGSVSFFKANIKDDSLFLKVIKDTNSEMIEDRFTIRSDNKTILIFNECKEFSLPMDSSISIKTAYIYQDSLCIDAEAEVRP